MSKEQEKIILFLFYAFIIIFILVIILGITEDTNTETEVYNKILQGEYEYVDGEKNYNSRYSNTFYKIFYKDTTNDIKSINVTAEQFYKIVEKNK